MSQKNIVKRRFNIWTLLMIGACVYVISVIVLLRKFVQQKQSWWVFNDALLDYVAGTQHYELSKNGNIAPQKWSNCFNFDNKSIEWDPSNLQRFLSSHSNDVRIYVTTNHQRRSKITNHHCGLPFIEFLVSPTFYSIEGQYFDRSQCENFSPQCLFDDLANLYDYIYRTQRNESTKWVIVFQDDIQMCPGLFKYLLQIIEQDTALIGRTANQVVLGQGETGVLTRMEHIPQYVDWLRTADYRSTDFGLMTTYSDATKYGVYWTLYNMVWHERTSNRLHSTMDHPHLRDQFTCSAFARLHFKKARFVNISYIDPYTMHVKRMN